MNSRRLIASPKGYVQGFLSSYLAHGDKMVEGLIGGNTATTLQLSQDFKNYALLTFGASDCRASSFPLSASRSATKRTHATCQCPP